MEEVILCSNERGHLWSEDIFYPNWDHNFAADETNIEQF